jgi:hypothetical protein
MKNLNPITLDWRRVRTTGLLKLKGRPCLVVRSHLAAGLRANSGVEPIEIRAWLFRNISLSFPEYLWSDVASFSLWSRNCVDTKWDFEASKQKTKIIAGIQTRQCGLENEMFS